MKTKKCKCKKCVAFRKGHDFEYLDIFGLYWTVSKYMIPRLEAFKKNTFSTPCFDSNVPGHTGKHADIKLWRSMLDKMILAFKLYSDEDDVLRKKMKLTPEKEAALCKEGMELFVKYFRDLWI